MKTQYEKFNLSLKFLQTDTDELLKLSETKKGKLDELKEQVKGVI